MWMGNLQGQDSVFVTLSFQNSQSAFESFHVTTNSVISESIFKAVQAQVESSTC